MLNKFGGMKRLAFHYPQQMFIKKEEDFIWSNLGNRTRIQMIELKTVEILKRRHNCFPDWKNFDEFIL